MVKTAVQPLLEAFMDLPPESLPQAPQEPSPQPAAESSGPSTRFGLALMALCSVPGLGRKGIAAISEHLKGELHQFAEVPQDELKHLLEKARVPSAHKLAQVIHEGLEEHLGAGLKSVEALTKASVSILAAKDLPPQLRSIPSPPPWLFVQGNVTALFQYPTVAVVGTREPSETGLKATQWVVRTLSAYPLTLVSGLAEGIDNQAHQSALDAGLPNVAFLGHGINEVFPKSTADTRALILERKGALVSEYLPNEHYRKQYFVERNRLQAALAALVIPVEAKAQSGTAHTVRFAKEYGRAMVGIAFKGNGILETLAKDGFPSVDIFSKAGRKELDRFVRAMAENGGQPTFALQRVWLMLQSEIQQRNVRVEDLNLLIGKLSELLDSYGRPD